MQNKQEFLYKCPNHAANLNDMRLRNKYCDVTIKVNGKEIRAHKVILAANLNHFEVMFSNGSFQESEGGVITIESVEIADLELIVSYAYTGQILLTEDNALNLLKLANYLREDGIEEACIEFLKKNLKPEEAFRAYNLACAMGRPLLMVAARAKLITHFEEFSKSADYLVLVDYGSLMDILSDAKVLSYQLQKVIFEGIIKWIRHSADNRKMFLKDLLDSIDVTALKDDDVMNCLYGNYLVHFNDEDDIAMDTRKYYEAKQIERKGRVKVLLVMSNTASYQFYNFFYKKWTSVLESPGFSAEYVYWPGAVLNDKLYYVGEISREFQFRVFDPLSMKSINLYYTGSILGGATLCACNRFIYICGGIVQNHSYSNQVLRYDSQTNSFEMLASMGIKRRGAASIFYQEYLYVLGGLDGFLVLQSVEKYDPVRNEWTAVASMCKERYGHGVAELNGKLYACGGYSGGASKSSVEVYDPTTNSWKLVASMNKARVNFLVVTQEGKLWAIGGEGEKTAEVYDPYHDHWQMDHEMSSGLQLGCRVGGLLQAF